MVTSSVISSFFVFVSIPWFAPTVSSYSLSVCLMGIILVLLKYQRPHWTLYWWNGQYRRPRNDSLRYFQETELEEGRKGKPGQLKNPLDTMWSPHEAFKQKCSDVWVEGELSLLRCFWNAVTAPEMLQSCCDNADLIASKLWPYQKWTFLPSANREA